MVVLKHKAIRSIMLAMLLAAGLLVVGLMALVEPAQATFPGNNGDIAFSSNRSGGYQIYSLSSTGTEQNLNPVTTNLAGTDHDPAYSPDGTKVAFSRTNGGETQIWTISATGGMNVNQITTKGTDNRDPTWSPDGTKIAFSSNRSGSYQIYSLSSTGTEQNLNPVTTNLAGTDYDPVYSPDGTKVAFTRITAGKHDIWTINSTGGGGTNQITTKPGNDVTPDWQVLPKGPPGPPGPPGGGPPGGPPGGGPGPPP